jgi:hypothetical protein
MRAHGQAHHHAGRKRRDGYDAHSMIQHQVLHAASTGANRFIAADYSSLCLPKRNSIIPATLSIDVCILSNAKAS